jgi:hypothetical protein
MASLLECAELYRDNFYGVTSQSEDMKRGI